MPVAENKKYLMCVVSYPDSKRQKYFETFHSPRNQEYCDYHGFEYLPITDFNTIPNYCKERSVYWYRHFLIRHWITLGRFKDGDIVSHLDADICIVNGSWPFEPPAGKNFAYAIDSCNTHCMGAFSHRITDWTERMLDNLLDEDRYNKFKDTPFWKVFQDQASWYSLAGITNTFADVNQPSWQGIADLGWNSTKESDPIYSLEELYENVEILPVEWNVTNWTGSSPYYRIPTKTQNKKDVIFRHFAGASCERGWVEDPIIFNKV